MSNARPNLTPIADAMVLGLFLYGAEEMARVLCQSIAGHCFIFDN
jgi:hypothetical protein